jgi:hypothetical protein
MQFLPSLHTLRIPSSNITINRTSLTSFGISVWSGNLGSGKMRRWRGYYKRVVSCDECIQKELYYVGGLRNSCIYAICTFPMLYNFTRTIMSRERKLLITYQRHVANRRGLLIFRNRERQDFGTNYQCIPSRLSFKSLFLMNLPGFRRTPCLHQCPEP